jgi:hypothetical protein
MGQEAPTMDKWDQKDKEDNNDSNGANANAAIICVIEYHVVVIPCYYIAGEYSIVGTVDLAGPVFHMFSSRNPDFIMYMAELKVDEFGMTFQLCCSKHLRYEFHIQYISTFYAKLVWWNNIP